MPTGEVKTLISALIIAADYKRDRAELCADCADQSCPTCEWRLRDAQAYDRAHVQLLQSGRGLGRRPATPNPPPSPRRTGRQASDPAARRHEPGRRPPDYVIVVAASDWITDRYPAAAASLTQALQPGQDRHRDPEPDLEAEP